MTSAAMPTTLSAVLFAVISVSAVGAPAESASACQDALDRLYQREEIQRDARSRGAATAAVSAALEVVRRQAAKACLGAAAQLPAPVQRVQPALSVAPIAVPEPAPPSLPPRLALPGPATSPVTPARPPLTTVNNCDSAGCWTSDGSYLMRVGPNLVGPPGLCTSQAGVLTCR